MQYRGFDEVELPNLTVTEANPAHWMDYRRFASRMVAEFNQLQVDILRELSPGRDIIHNFMGRILDFDHFELGAQLDVSSWDSYPSGSSTRCATCSDVTTGLPLPAPAIPISRPFTMTFTAPPPVAAGGSWNSSRAGELGPEQHRAA